MKNQKIVVGLDGKHYSYDAETQICELRQGAGNIPTGVWKAGANEKTYRAGWFVGERFNVNGRNGMYARYGAYVIRPQSHLRGGK